MNMRRIDRYFAATNRLRTEGTDHLLAAARDAGARLFVSQSYAGWPFARTGGPVKGEDDPLDPDPPTALRDPLAAIQHLEEAVTGITWAEGIVLRYGTFYGPGTGISADPEATMTKPVRKRQFPLVGAAGGVWSFVHVADAATATVEAIEHGAAGVYQVVDDEPAPVSEWLPELARALDARSPRRLPSWLGRLAAGEAATLMITDVRGASNGKTKRELGWQPAHPSWRTGFAGRRGPCGLERARHVALQARPDELDDPLGLQRGQRLEGQDVARGAQPDELRAAQAHPQLRVGDVRAGRRAGRGRPSSASRATARRPGRWSWPRAA